MWFRRRRRQCDDTVVVVMMQNNEPLPIGYSRHTNNNKPMIAAAWIRYHKLYIQRRRQRILLLLLRE